MSNRIFDLDVKSNQICQGLLQNYVTKLKSIKLIREPDNKDVATQISPFEGIKKTLS